MRSGLIEHPGGRKVGTFGDSSPNIYIITAYRTCAPEVRAGEVRRLGCGNARPFQPAQKCSSGRRLRQSGVGTPRAQSKLFRLGQSLSI